MLSKLDAIACLCDKLAVVAAQLDVSVVEIYCESIKDLLCSDPGSTSLSVQQDKEHGIIIAGAAKMCQSCRSCSNVQRNSISHHCFCDAQTLVMTALDYFSLLVLASSCGYVTAV